MRRTSLAPAKPSPQTPETQVTGLITTRDSLRARQAAVVAEVERAVAERRRLLIEGSDPVVIAEAERVCREVESTAYGIADALAEVERRIVAAETRIATAREHARIEAVAAGLERNAGEIEAGAAALSKAIGEVARTYTNLAVAISGTSAGQFDPVNGVATPSQIAAELALQGFVRAVPGLDLQARLKPWTGYDYRQRVEGIDPVATATEFGERLRAAAEMVRAREIGPDLPEAHAVPPTFEPDRREYAVYVTAPFFYVRRGVRVMETPGPRSLPAPVADLAVAKGLASNDPPPKRDLGSAVLPFGGPYKWEDCDDLGFDLSEWEAENVEAQREAFRSDGGLKAA